MRACIPTIGLSPLLPALLDTLAEAGADTVLWVNGDDEDAARVRRCSGNTPIRRRQGCTIYAEWNDAMDEAVRLGDDLLLILNDDIVLTAAAVHIVRDLVAGDDRWAIVGFDHLRTDGPQRIIPVSGTYREGGVPGFAFAVRPDRCPRVDERFTWWGGDDDLVWSAEALGQGVGRAVGAPVDHPFPSLSANQRPEVAEAISQDHDRLMTKWGRAW